MVFFRNKGTSGRCCIGQKVEVYEAELHAIQEGLLLILTVCWAPSRILVCADNQSALTTLTEGNPTNSGYARCALAEVDLL